MTAERDELANEVGVGGILADAILAAGYRKGTEEVEYQVKDRVWTFYRQTLAGARRDAVERSTITRRSRWVTEWAEEVIE
jgi:hypothetical protein